MSNALPSGYAFHFKTYRAAYFFVKNLLELELVASTFVKLYDAACEDDREHFPMVLALEALMLMYTSTRSKSTFVAKWCDFKWSDFVGVLNNQARIQALFDEADALAISLGDVDLDACYQ